MLLGEIGFTMRPYMRKRILALALCVLATGTSAWAKCNEKLSPFLEGSEFERLGRIVKLQAMGKDAIALLLPEVGNSGAAEGVLLVNPESSALIGDPGFSYCGLVSAYLIEVILAGSELRMDAHQDRGEPEGYLFLGASPENYPYWLGVVTIPDGTYYGRPVGRFDLPRISGQYLQWWTQNKERSLDALRADWKDGKRPLTGSQYSWH